MSTLEVVSVEYQGKLYEDCNVTIDETNTEFSATRTRKFLWRKEEARIFSMHYDEATVIHLHGRVVRVDDLSISARDEAESASIAALLGKPRRAALEQRTHGRREAERAVSVFLKSRAEALAFLANLRADPRGTLFTLASSTKGPDPLAEWRRSHQARLSKYLEYLDSAIASAERLGEYHVGERLYAVAYLVGEAQNAIFEGDSRRLVALKPLAVDLGVDAGLFSGLKAETVTEQLLESLRVSVPEEPSAASPVKG